jgi:hypothetical protein
MSMNTRSIGKNTIPDDVGCKTRQDWLAFTLCPGELKLLLQASLSQAAATREPSENERRNLISDVVNAALWDGVVWDGDVWH